MSLQFPPKIKREQLGSVALAPESDLSSSFCPLGRSRKKRSMLSSFTASDDSDATTTSSPTAQVHMQNVGEKPADNIFRAHVSFGDPELTGQFEPKDIWTTRNNMKLHPYHKHVPYMQAYDPILLERRVHISVFSYRLFD